MADNVKNGQEPKKRGRPPKVKPEPVVNEAPERLEMVSKSETPAPIENIMRDLTGVYKRAFAGGWCGGVDFNRYNPFLQNDRLKMLNTRPGTMSREELTDALKAPAEREL